MGNVKIIKDGYRERPSWVSESDYNLADYGTEFYNSNLKDLALSSIYNFDNSPSANISFLKNTINRLNALDDIYNYDNVIGNHFNIICINSYHLGSGIRKGSVELNYYFTGSFIGKAQDKLQNGVLYDTKNDNKKVGFVLYKEGFVVLTNSEDLNNNKTDFGLNINDYAKWIYFGLNRSSNTEIVCEPIFDFINIVPTFTTTVTLEKNTANHSNNLTYIESGSYSHIEDKNYFKENSLTKIKNITKSPFNSAIANQEKETYITKIGLYDESKKLIGIASLANPVRKTENREFLFKIKVDI
jgi:hypothetical protein